MSERACPLRLGLERQGPRTRNPPHTSRPREALGTGEESRPVEPVPRADLRLLVLDALYSVGDSSAAEQAVRQLAHYADAPLASGVAERSSQYYDLCTVALWRVAHRELRGVGRAIAQLRSAELPQDSTFTVAGSATCAAILEAALAAAQHQSSAHDARERLDSLLRTGPAGAGSVFFKGFAAGWQSARGSSA